MPILERDAMGGGVSHLESAGGLGSLGSGRVGGRGRFRNGRFRLDDSVLMMVIKVVDHVIAVAIVHRDENRWRDVVVALALLSPALTAGRQRGAHRRPFDVMHHAQRHTPRSLRCGRRLRRRGWRVKSGLRRRVMGHVHRDRREVLQARIGMPRDGERPHAVDLLSLGSANLLWGHAVEQHEVESTRAVACAALSDRSIFKLLGQLAQLLARLARLVATPWMGKHAQPEVLVRAPGLAYEAAGDASACQRGAWAHGLRNVVPSEHAVCIQPRETVPEAPMEAGGQRA